jgi:hypothetical protein
MVTVDFNSMRATRRPESLIERRDELRRKVTIPAIVASNSGLWRLPAQIIDISNKGAKILLKEDYFLSRKSVILVDLLNQNVYQCNIQWQKGGQFGVFFVDVFTGAQRRKLFEIHSRGK